MAFIEADGMLAGLPPETAKVEIVWAANDLGTDLGHVLVVARGGDTLLWQYEIEDAGEAGGVVIPFPSPDEPPPAPDADGDNEDLVKPKTTPVEKPTKK
jgi:hypothetical protein